MHACENMASTLAGPHWRSTSAAPLPPLSPPSAAPAAPGSRPSEAAAVASRLRPSEGVDAECGRGGRAGVGPAPSGDAALPTSGLPRCCGSRGEGAAGEGEKCWLIACMSLRGGMASAARLWPTLHTDAGLPPSAAPSGDWCGEGASSVVLHGASSSGRSGEARHEGKLQAASCRRCRCGGAPPGPKAGSVVQVFAGDDAPHRAALIHHAQVAQGQRQEQVVHPVRRHLAPHCATMQSSRERAERGQAGGARQQGVRTLLRRPPLHLCRSARRRRHAAHPSWAPGS